MALDIFSPEIAPVVGSLITGAFALQLLFTKWLISHFKELRVEFQNINEKILKWLDDHEDQDQHRHEDNLYRFEKIAVALARLGSENGTYEKRNNGVPSIHH